METFTVTATHMQTFIYCLIWNKGITTSIALTDILFFYESERKCGQFILIYCTSTGLVRIFLAKASICLGNVAENNTVCLSGRIQSRILLT